MKSIWHPEAKRAMLDVAHYIQTKFGTKARKDVAGFWDTRCEPKQQAAKVK